MNKNLVPEHTTAVMNHINEYELNHSETKHLVIMPYFIKNLSMGQSIVNVLTEPLNFQYKNRRALRSDIRKKLPKKYTTFPLTKKLNMVITRNLPHLDIVFSSKDSDFVYFNTLIIGLDINGTIYCTNVYTFDPETMIAGKSLDICINNYINGNTF